MALYYCEVLRQVMTRRKDGKEILPVQVPVLEMAHPPGNLQPPDLSAVVGSAGRIGYLRLAFWFGRAFYLVNLIINKEIVMILHILTAAGGSFLNRVRGGLFDFGGNKLLFPFFLGLTTGDARVGLCTFIAAYVGQQFGWGTYIGALYGTKPAQAEVPQIDEIVNSARITLKGKTTYLAEYPVWWGFAALGLRGLLWSFLTGLAVNSVPAMVCGLLMPVCYGATGLIDKQLLKKGGKTAWNLGEWLWGAVLTGFVIW